MIFDFSRFWSKPGFIGFSLWKPIKVRKWSKIDLAIWAPKWLQIIVWVLKTCLGTKITPETVFKSIFGKFEILMILGSDKWENLQSSKCRFLTIFENFYKITQNSVSRLKMASEFDFFTSKMSRSHLAGVKTIFNFSDFSKGRTLKLENRDFGHPVATAQNAFKIWKLKWEEI